MRFGISSITTMHHYLCSTTDRSSVGFHWELFHVYECMDEHKGGIPSFKFVVDVPLLYLSHHPLMHNLPILIAGTVRRKAYQESSKKAKIPYDRTRNF